jgi:glycosyltransferase involved in cell wall biosynthesis
VHDIHDNSWSGRWTLPIFNFIWRRADRVIAISQAVKDWLVKDRAVPAENVSVIHYGIEAERFSQSSLSSELLAVSNRVRAMTVYSTQSPNLKKLSLVSLC